MKEEEVEAALNQLGRDLDDMVCDIITNDRFYIDYREQAPSNIYSQTKEVVSLVWTNRAFGFGFILSPKSPLNNPECDTVSHFLYYAIDDQSVSRNDPVYIKAGDSDCFTIVHGGKRNSSNSIGVDISIDQFYSLLHADTLSVRIGSADTPVATFTITRDEMRLIRSLWEEKRNKAVWSDGSPYTD